MVEFLIAAFIMAVGLLGLTMLQVQAVAQATNGRAHATAVYIADWILQRAQVEGQQSYFAKLKSATMPYTALFTASTVTQDTLNTYGGFNIDGLQVTDSSGVDISSSVVPTPAADKRFPMFTASWSRRAYQGTAPDAAAAQAQEFVVNVQWTESIAGGTPIQKNLSISRVLRY